MEKGHPNSQEPVSNGIIPANDLAAMTNPEAEQQMHQQKPNESPVLTRTGCLSFLVIIPTIADATQYGRPTKWLLTVIISLAALAAPLGSNILLR